MVARCRGAIRKEATGKFSSRWVLVGVMSVIAVSERWVRRAARARDPAGVIGGIGGECHRGCPSRGARGDLRALGQSSRHGFEQLREQVNRELAQGEVE